jgi:hypothetical protein
MSNVKRRPDYLKNVKDILSKQKSAETGAEKFGQKVADILHVSGI